MKYLSFFLLFAACSVNVSTDPDATEVTSIDTSVSEDSGQHEDTADTQDTSEPQDTADTGDTGAEASGLECTFNEDCPTNERCGCWDGADDPPGEDPEDGICNCELGDRGTGVAGVDSCTSSNDCASSLCVEGNDEAFYCSGPCESAEDCGSNLPVCDYIYFLGDVCQR